MRRPFSMLVAGSAMAVAASIAPAYAETAAADAAAEQPGDTVPAANASPAEEVSEEGDGGDAIIVTARRQEEDLQEVPSTINVVTGEVLEKLNTFAFEDLSKLVPGLVLNRAGGPSVAIRGVTFTPASQTTPNVAFYLNEGPVQPTLIFSSLYDVGQIEVLKGPQGTFRGVSAPGGAITYYTKRPDLDEFGGTFSGTVSDLDARRLTGAVNLPVIDGRLALRLAGLADRTDGNSPRSVNSGTEPLFESDSFRVSARAEPIDNLSAIATYQYLSQKTVSFSPVVGNGAVGGPAAFNVNYTGRYVQPAGVNGPVIPVGQFLSVQDAPARGESKFKFASAQVDYVALGQKLSYVGSYSKIKQRSLFSSGDIGNLIVGDIPGINFDADIKRKTHEGRLSSDEPLFGFLDYTVGAFHFREDGFTRNTEGTLQNNSLAINAGAFGSPLGAPIAATPNFRYINFTRFIRNPFSEETSFFGHLIAHIGERTEIAGGVRFVDFEKDEGRVNFRTDAFRAVAFVNAAGQPVNPQTTTGAPTAGRVAITAAQCTTLSGQFGVTFAGVCDVPVPGMAPTPAVTGAALSAKPTLFSASAKHELSDNLMVYANFGTAFRPGPPQNVLNMLSDPYLDNLRVLPIERSKSYEAGFKARIAGFDIDLGFDATRNWTVNAGFSWSNGKFSNNLVPCFDPDFDGAPNPLVSTDPFRNLGTIVTAGTPANAFFKQELANRNIVLQTCSVNQGFVDLANPKWNATARTEWHNEIFEGLEGFVNGNMTYRPKNSRNPVFTQEAFALVDLNLGVRSREQGWEITGFVKNLFNDRTIFSFATNDVGSQLPGGSSALFSPAGSATPAGYRSISYVPRREVGLTARYSFGSR